VPSSASVPINHKEWPRKSFHPVLRKLGIRLLYFDSTRDTFISEMLRAPRT
jgi:hypothetical protein